jgi:SAM-dependent methyltransferase
MTATPPAFTTRDPAAADFWNERFAAGFTPWDAGSAPPAFARWLATLGPGAGRRVLVPGCGSGYEGAALDAAGFAVTAIDYAATAVAQARAVLGAALADRVLRQADFFTFAEDAAGAAARFDLIYERAFVAALPPTLWPRWAARCAALLLPGGEMAGLFVIEAQVPAPRRGPPFATTRAELAALLNADFALHQAQPVPAAESLPVFAGHEQWLVWQRRPTPPTGG